MACFALLSCLCIYLLHLHLLIVVPNLTLTNSVIVNLFIFRLLLLRKSLRLQRWMQLQVAKLPDLELQWKLSKESLHTWKARMYYFQLLNLCSLPSFMWNHQNGFIWIPFSCLSCFFFGGSSLDDKLLISCISYHVQLQ